MKMANKIPNILEERIKYIEDLKAEITDKYQKEIQYIETKKNLELVQRLKDNRDNMKSLTDEKNRLNLNNDRFYHHPSCDISVECALLYENVKRRTMTYMTKEKLLDELKGERKRLIKEERKPQCIQDITHAIKELKKTPYGKQSFLEYIGNFFGSKK